MAPSQDASDQQDHYSFSRRSLLTFTFHWNPGRGVFQHPTNARVHIIFKQGCVRFSRFMSPFYLQKRPILYILTLKNTKWNTTTATFNRDTPPQAKLWGDHWKGHRTSPWKKPFFEKDTLRPTTSWFCSNVWDFWWEVGAICTNWPEMEGGSWVEFLLTKKTAGDAAKVTSLPPLNQSFFG